ncbi:DUF3616 domain-containing protein [Ruegeria sp. HKCCD8929]|uniref:DUF3616 domain-containing protein n=1 Tax=Ruegeria sp. HKCCD8929 TaxID=2683006 RepID=UPI00148881EF|nr:DUF3616 domain-containing protein [Ruegeria sp. HKCCD8929]
MRVLLVSLLLVSFSVFAEPPTALKTIGIFEEYDEKDGEVVLGASVNVSGAVCMETGPCFAVADEGRFAQVFALENDRITIGQRLYLAETKDKPKRELRDFDLEGLTATGNTLIAVGSHSRGRKSCKSPDRSLRIFWGEVTGDLIGTRQPLTDRPQSLEPLFEQFETLEQSFDQPLQKNGLNIEGIAARGSTILVGFRAPFTSESSASVLVAEFTLDALENGDFSGAQLHHVAVDGPPGRGIRGMEAVGDEMILLIGDSGVGAGNKAICDQPSPHRVGEFSVHRWTPGQLTAEAVMTLDLPDEDWKAEGILPMGDEGVLIFFDGPPNGAPHFYEFP